jgi:branched-chain amino acid transport system permease protein
MVTIAIGQALMLISQNLLNLTGGPMGLAGIGRPVLFGAGSGGYSLWVITAVALALMLLLTRVLEKSVMGRAWVAIRESETLARSTGINTFNFALVAYVAGALFAGVGGSLYAHYVGFVDPSIFAFAWSSMTVVAVVIGGRGTLWGPVIGGVLVTLLPEYLRVAAMWRLPMFGLVLILIIIFMPDGLVSLGRLAKRVRIGRRPPVALSAGGGRKS